VFLSISSAIGGLAVKEIEIGSNVKNIHPFVSNANDCGTPGETGTLLTVYATQCARSPCSWQPRETMSVDVLFTAGKTSETLRVVATAIMDSGTEVEIINSLIEGSIVEGTSYQLPDVQIVFQDSFLHQNVLLKIELFDDPSGYIEVCANFRVNILEAKVTNTVFMDLTIGNDEVGRVYIGMFGDVVPRTVENFVTICDKGINGTNYRYSGNLFHRVISNFMIQGGDVVYEDGRGSISIYGPTFEDENFVLRHLAPGYLSMANAGPNTNGCQFFITTVTTAWLDGAHVVFGKVIDGMEVVKAIEATQTDGNNRPIQRAGIRACGLL